MFLYRCFCDFISAAYDCLATSDLYLSSILRTIIHSNTDSFISGGLATVVPHLSALPWRKVGITKGVPLSRCRLSILTRFMDVR